MEVLFEWKWRRVRECEVNEEEVRERESLRLVFVVYDKVCVCFSCFLIWKRKKK